METTPQNTMSTLEDWLKASVFHVDPEPTQWILPAYVVSLFDSYREPQ